MFVVALVIVVVVCVAVVAVRFLPGPMRAECSSDNFDLRHFPRVPMNLSLQALQNRGLGLYHLGIFASMRIMICVAPGLQTSIVSLQDMQQEKVEIKIDVSFYGMKILKEYCFLIVNLQFI